MKIALLGYGKMGQLVETIAEQRGHSIIQKVGIDDLLDHELLRTADMAIDFSAPDIVLNHIYACFDANVPIVVGTTGWYGSLQQVKNDCLQRNNTLLYGSNFSIGVNVFFNVNKYLARLMAGFPAYDIQLEEIHHTEKVDSPSGTAMTLAEDILSNSDVKKEWINLQGDEIPERDVTKDQLIVRSYRIANVSGTHGIVYGSETDDIEIRHTAHNRNGFAEGAVFAAEWLANKQGFYTIGDVFKFD